MRPQRLRSFSLAILTALAATASGQSEIRIVARPVTATPSDPNPLGFTGAFTNLAISPDGKVAFNASHRVQLPNGSRQVVTGAFAERSGPPALVTAALINDVQNVPVVFGLDADGNALLRGRLSNSPTIIEAFAVDRPVGGPLTLLATGSVAPGMPDRTISAFVSTFASGSIQPPRYLPAGLRYPMAVIVTPRFTPTGDVFSAVVRGSVNGPQLLTTSGQLNTPGAPPVLATDWAYDVNANGEFITAGSNPSVYRDGAVRPLLAFNALVPGGLPNERVTTSLNYRLGSDGTVLAAYATNQNGAIVLMGPPDNLQVVFRSNDLIVSARGTARPSLSLTTGPVPMSIDENGVGYIMARTVTLSNPGGAILPVCVVRVKRGEPASIAYLSTEPVRRRSGELVELFVIAAAPDLNTSQAGSRFVWYTAIRNGATVICSLTDDGDPYIVFESQTSVGSPPLAIPQNLLPTSAPPGTPPVFIANARGDAALVISVGSAVIASPAVNFTCGDVDFNNDGVFPTDQDVVDFLDVFAGAPYPTLRCDTIDFNRDGASPQDQDVIDFFNVLAGGSCS